jgi:hypothetical protein
MPYKIKAQRHNGETAQWLKTNGSPTRRGEGWVLEKVEITGKTIETQYFASLKSIDKKP